MFHRRDTKSQSQSESPAKQTDVHFKIRSLSDGSAWGWGPTRTKP
jgi:hypothetical protein